MKKIIKVIPHPKHTGHWTVSINGAIYGCYDERSCALAVALDPKL